MKFLRWFFCDRRNGAITIAQAPNSVLWIAIVAGVVLAIWPQNGKFGFALTVMFKGSVLIWSADEIARGVNPWRRCLGVIVGAWELFAFF